jgi:hypothetical protein
MRKKPLENLAQLFLRKQWALEVLGLVAGTLVEGLDFPAVHLKPLL